MIYHDVEQNTDEWFDLRAGKITTSALSYVMANFGKAFNDKANNYAIRIALEQITKARVEDDSFSNKWMEFGHEYEPIAREVYEEEMLKRGEFIVPENGGFCESEVRDYLGCSPDHLVPVMKGVGEIKCVKYNTHFATLKRNSYDPKYKWQLAGNMWICEADWIDYIEYCPVYPEKKKLFVHRITKEMMATEISMIQERLNLFEAKVSQAKETILNP